MEGKTIEMWKKTKDYHSKGLKSSQNGKDSANDQLQGDQRQSEVTSEYCVCEANLSARSPCNFSLLKKKTRAEEDTIHQRTHQLA